MKARKFVDSVLVHAEAGAGGNGCVSFRREKFVPRGGPDGGDGGRGGSVILRGSREVDSLIHLYFQPHQRAERGIHGKGKQLYGHNGRDCVVPVPCGTEVWNTETGALLGDIVQPDQELVVARGGNGGLGNVHWKSATHRAPREHTDGGAGENVSLRLELKLIAHAGLVGFPNAGKSSLIAAISDAHPKVASYPFTTLNPIIGTLIFDDYARITVADLPGLLKGASEGIGLGDAFLRHIERATVLVYVIDMAGVDGRKPHQDYADLKDELRAYREDLLERPFLVVANKMDLPEAAENLKTFKRRTRTKPLCVSTVDASGLQEVRSAIRKCWDAAQAPMLQNGQPTAIRP